MKKIVSGSLLVLLLVSLFNVTGCSGGGGSAGLLPIEKKKKVTVKGSFSNGTNASIWLNKIFAWVFPPAYALDPAQVTKVIVFNGNNEYWVAPVTDDNFAISVNQGSPAGLVFAGAGNNFLGYLTLDAVNGIDSLPLTKIESGVTTIDLQTLSSSGLVVESSYNPIGTEMVLSDEEKTAIAHGDDFFASVIKNPDVDGDGTIDLLDGKFYRPSVLYFITGGSFNGVSSTPVITAGIDNFKFAFDVWDAAADSFPSENEVSLTLPGDTTLAFDQKNIYSDRATYFSPEINSPAIPAQGDYVVLYSAKTLTFSIPDQAAATANIVIPVPTVTLNDNGTINKVAWDYKLGGSGSAIDPQTIMESVELQIDGSGDKCGNPIQQFRIYNSGELAPATVEHVLRCQNLQWANVDTMYMTYNDVYGNHVVVTWNKPTPE